MTLIIGIDDAGRGPVIGPLILAGVILEEKEHPKLIELKVKDSKLLSPRTRKAISEKIYDNFETHTEITQPKEIDESPNLNDLEAIKTAMIINKLSKNKTGKIKAIIDCPSVNLNAWKGFLSKLIENKEIELIVEHKADLNHPVVSAASIIAKEKREDEVKKIKEKIKMDFGSGYPADPKTKEFIEKNFDNPLYKEIIRFSWSTWKKLNNSTNQKSLKEF